ncbi:MAG: T9SS type A sorting domain-containing protein, partial [Bacteroidota bacterium]|nr:T9SS type A sorting domain-containing protein [Bacteroidota bacterium]
QANDSWTVLSNVNNNMDSILISPTLVENSINVSGVNSNQFKILIFNQLGQKLLEFHNEKKVDVSKLPSGVYLLSFQGAQSNKQHKFIKK